MKTPLNTLGASNHSDKERAANDYYGTPPTATRALLERLATDSVELTSTVAEVCAGHHMIANVLEEHGYQVDCRDLVDYGFNDTIVDFLDSAEQLDCDIITNPPYYLAEEFVLKALESVKNGNHVIMLLRTLFLEGQKRYEHIFKESPPKYVYVFSKRQVCSANDNFSEPSAVSYSWFIWEKGFTGNPEIRWL